VIPVSDSQDHLPAPAPIPSELKSPESKSKKKKSRKADAESAVPVSESIERSAKPAKKRKVRTESVPAGAIDSEIPLTTTAADIAAADSSESHPPLKKSMLSFSSASLVNTTMIMNMIMIMILLFL
jgi:hypothetical protein